MPDSIDRLGAALRDYAEGVARAVFAPDRYEGPWQVNWRGRFKVCKTYVGAVALADRCRRQDLYGNITIQKVI